MTRVAPPGYGQGMSPNVTTTPPRPIRIGDTWYEAKPPTRADRQIAGSARAALAEEEPA